MRYTEQEIEMLARFWLAAHADDWECESQAQIKQARADVSRFLDAVTNFHFKRNVVCSAARLMREARGQGAEEMRERCAAELDAKNYPPEYAGNAIRALPLTVP